MPVQVGWDSNHGTVIRVEVRNFTTWADIYDTVQAEVDALEPVAHPVCFIIDLRYADLSPADALPNLRRLVAVLNFSRSTKVIVGANRLLQMMLRSVGSLYPDFGEDYFFVLTIEDAYDILEAHECYAPC